MQSKLLLSTKLTTQAKTQLDRYFASSPFKVMTLPNLDSHWTNALNAMQMSSSPGLLAGDQLEIDIEIADNTALSLLTQAFTRVQSMNKGDYATQKTCIKLGKNSRLFYLPHPLVLHKDSSFKQTTEIEMDENAELIYGEIVAIGRVLNGERFAFRHFASYLRISHQNRPLVSDRIQWLPAQMALTSLSQMEDFSHQGSLTYLNLAKNAIEIKVLVLELQTLLAEQQNMLAGVSQLNEGGLMVRVLAHRADSIQQLFERIGQQLKTHSVIESF
ncbi:urease accessory protein UreD [Actinobacillus vicugnae]|uniref:urease accessory protein UreD n=1 Tax=Actinobacillus vicugnae TaxID=2573093 RepID=UPI00123F60FE|nr:urease accessory protein UreD [Actinobacillus vicugnae]